MSRSDKGAVFDSTGQYRYRLWRSWNYVSEASWNSASVVGFVMLNPNQADAIRDDPTIRRCMGFAKAWGFGGLEVVNLFAYRAKTPQFLKQATDPIGEENDQYLSTLPERVDLIVLAWGNWGRLWNRDRTALNLLRSQPVYSLGITKLGQPRHPLYLRRDSDRIPFISTSNF